MGHLESFGAFLGEGGGEANKVMEQCASGILWDCVFLECMYIRLSYGYEAFWEGWTDV
jgi:hypothetical protein